MEELIRFAASSLNYLDNRMQRYFSGLARDRTGTHREKDIYELRRKSLNGSLQRASDFQDIFQALLSYFQIISELLNQNVLTEEEDGRLRQGTLESLQDYMYRAEQYKKFEDEQASLQRDLRKTAFDLERHQRETAAQELTLQQIRRDLADVYGPLQKKYDELQIRVEADFTHLENRKKEIDSLAGFVTGKAVTSSYQRAAISERKIADDLRNASLGCMALVCIMAGISTIYTLRDFELSAAIFRLFFTLLLSVPAAYLARESAKHRQQQYTHLQTALDVQAITPYIASLPLGKQHKLKEEMASRVFVAKSFDYVSKESYPINVQEIIVALINAGKSKKAKKDQKKKPEEDD